MNEVLMGLRSGSLQTLEYGPPLSRSALSNLFQHSKLYGSFACQYQLEIASFIAPQLSL